jgi:hypothetical protein
MIVDFHPEGFQPSKEREIVEKSSHGCCVAIVFGNLAHNFAVTKSGDGTWTVKDACLISRFCRYFLQNHVSCGKPHVKLKLKML